MRILIFIALITNLYSCKELKEVNVVKTPDADSIKYTTISLKDIKTRLPQLDGIYVEAEGTFVNGYEEFSIHMDDGSNGISYVWLELNDELSKKNIDFKSLSNRKVRVRGQLNAFNHGHMGSYLCTIEKIYYWRTL